jgi:hypothetical protein
MTSLSEKGTWLDSKMALKYGAEILEDSTVQDNYA